jgi:hypothetical protein
MSGFVCGLDASTSIVGYAFSDERKKIRDAGFLNISKLENNREKGKFVIGFLKNHAAIKYTEKINLEAALSGFGGGFTSQQTIITLSRWNAILEYILYEELGIPVTLCDVNSMRKIILGAAWKKGIKPKEYVKMKLPEVVPNLKDFEKLNRKGEWDAHNSDMYDAVVCSLFG